MGRLTAVSAGNATPSIAALFFELRDDPHPVVPADVAVGWAAEFPTAIDLLRPAGHDLAYQWRLSTRDEHDPLQVMLWELYALSRVLELMIAPYQPATFDTADPWYTGPLPERPTYVRFAAAIGLTPVAEDEFHPFFHEIVEVEQADDADEPITLLGEVWPGYLLGSMLMQRAGVRVRAGAAHAVAAVAAGARLHWAWWRRNRDTVDNSHGWGRNSQWRTDFRRDYRTTDGLYYNVDARPERLRDAGGEPPLSSVERLELLRHRCVLRRAEAAGTAWDWADDLRYCEPLG
jgi:hypothetical protein